MNNNLYNSDMVGRASRRAFPRSFRVAPPSTPIGITSQHLLGRPTTRPSATSKCDWPGDRTSRLQQLPIRERRLVFTNTFPKGHFRQFSMSNDPSVTHVIIIQNSNFVFVFQFKIKMRGEMKGPISTRDEIRPSVIFFISHFSFGNYMLLLAKIEK